MGKLLIMSTNPQANPQTNPQTNPQATGKDEPLTASAFRDLAAVIDIFRTLGGINQLEATIKSHAEKIEQVTQSVSTIPRLEKDVEKNTKDLNELGKELNGLGQRLDRQIGDLRANEISDLKSFASTTRTLGYIALSVITVIFTYLYLRLSQGK
ncbi:MAG TPA: hypothetical protein VNZ56_07910 [Verrucomicrobiae bacterium]|jgi:hypothetical protein|nr:hypothetical protein [Verrucomicrobiae bacterium]